MSDSILPIDSCRGRVDGEVGQWCGSCRRLSTRTKAPHSRHHTHYSPPTAATTMIIKELYPNLCFVVSFLKISLMHCKPRVDAPHNRRGKHFENRELIIFFFYFFFFGYYHAVSSNYCSSYQCSTKLVSCSVWLKRVNKKHRMARVLRWLKTSLMMMANPRGNTLRRSIILEGKGTNNHHYCNSTMSNYIRSIINTHILTAPSPTTHDTFQISTRSTSQSHALIIHQWIFSIELSIFLQFIYIVFNLYYCIVHINLINYLSSRLPGWVKAFIPGNALKLEEKAWNAYPYCKTGKELTLKLLY